MIKTIEKSEHNYSTSDGFYIKCYREISKEEYDRLHALSHADLNEIIGEELGDTIHFGYGYYGGGLFTKDGRYYYYYKRGASCD